MVSVTWGLLATVVPNPLSSFPVSLASPPLWMGQEVVRAVQVTGGTGASSHAGGAEIPAPITLSPPPPHSRCRPAGPQLPGLEGQAFTSPGCTQGYRTIRGLIWVSGPRQAGRGKKGDETVTGLSSEHPQCAGSHLLQGSLGGGGRNEGTQWQFLCMTAL